MVQAWLALSLASWLTIPSLPIANSFQEISQSVLIRQVPDVEQIEDYTCGPASLLAVLSTYGIDVTEQELEKAADTDPEVGANITALARVARSFGFKARYESNWTLRKLERELLRGHPVIILGQAWREGADVKRPWREVWDAGHYMVVIGIDENHVYLEDPWIKGSRGSMTHQEFVDRWRGWSDQNEKRWAQVVVIDGEIDEHTPAVDLPWAKIK